MTATIQEFLNNAKSLSLDERYELIDALVAMDEPPLGKLIGEVYLAELKRRSDEIDQGDMTGYTWDEVRLNARQKLGMPIDG